MAINLLTAGKLFEGRRLLGVEEKVRRKGR